MRAVVRPIELPPAGRALAVSDIHGNLPCLKGLLRRAAFGREDALILLGDLVEKGRESLATLRYVMALSRTHTVYALRGNCDNLAVALMDGGGEEAPLFRFYLRAWGERSLLLQMAREAGLAPDERRDLSLLRARLRGPFAPELDFLRALPTILTAPGYVFVHGGVPSFDRMEELDAWTCMKNDAFWEQGYSFPHYCVVGHWPVSLYRADRPCSRPLIDRARKIACIDGGCVLKADGQLNALVLPGPGGEDFSWFSYDGLPVRRALDGQDESPDPLVIRWTDHRVEVLERGAEFSLCRHRSTGRTLSILTKYLRGRAEEAWCMDATDYRLPVSPGDLLSVVEETSRGCLVKKEGVTGWYGGRLEPVGAEEPGEPPGAGDHRDVENSVDKWKTR